MLGYASCAVSAVGWIIVSLATRCRGRSIATNIVGRNFWRRFDVEFFCCAKMPMPAALHTFLYSLPQPLLYNINAHVWFFFYFAGAENSDRGRQMQEDTHTGGAESNEAAHRRQEPQHNPRRLPPAASARLHRARCVHEPSAVYDDGYLLRGTGRGGEETRGVPIDQSVHHVSLFVVFCRAARCVSLL